MLPLKLVIILFFIPYLWKCNAKDYCSSEYCNNNKQHTLCKYRSQEPASHCIDYEKTISTDNERIAILDKINSRRNKVAAGEIRSLPSAASMMKLEWNKELEVSAQRWADQCIKHSVPDIKDNCRDLVCLDWLVGFQKEYPHNNLASCKITSDMYARLRRGVAVMYTYVPNPMGFSCAGEMYVEQNIATVHGDAPGLTSLALVDVWYMELLNMNASIIPRFQPSSDLGHSHYDYFTQLIWEDSNQVGCGGVKFKELLEDENDVKYRTIYRLVCNFAPGGNRRNRTVYSSGPPCSRCPFGGICDSVYKGLCSSKHIKMFTGKMDDKVGVGPNPVIVPNSQYATNNISPTMPDAITEDDADTNEMNNMSTEPSSENTDTTFDYYPHLYDFTQKIITMPTLKTNTCKDVKAVEEFVELLKRKLNNDPVIKELLSTAKPIGSHGNTDGLVNDEGVAAFIDRIYSKKEPPTSTKTVVTNYVNSTLLVDLIEAVIFRNSDKIPVTEEYRTNTQPLNFVKPIMVQAELAEIKENQDFTGHYFFPEDDDEEINRETTESYYDSSNLAISDVVLEIEDLKFSTVTKDFLEDILESDTATENFDNTLISYSLTNETDRQYLNYYSNIRREKREDQIIDGNEYYNKHTTQPTILTKRYKKQLTNCCETKHDTFVINYKQILKKIASDLKELKLNERLQCSRNSTCDNVYSLSISILCIMFLKLNVY